MAYLWRVILVTVVLAATVVSCGQSTGTSQPSSAPQATMQSATTTGQPKPSPTKTGY